jgi:hypothetical protein
MPAVALNWRSARGAVTTVDVRIPMRPASRCGCGLASDGSRARRVDCFAVTSEPTQPKAADDPGTAVGGGMAIFYVVAIALSLLVGAAVAIPEYLPTNDGPQHVFSSHAARHLGTRTWAMAAS